MQCNWSIAARNVFQSGAQLGWVHSRIAQSIRKPLITSKSSLMRTFATTIASATPASDQYVPATSPPSSLTVAQVSRAACRAVHKCLQLHSLGDAYFVVNSLRFSNFQHEKSLIKFTGVGSRNDFARAAIQFGRPISSKLSSHALLHGLVRAGLTKKAYKLSRLMIGDGIRVRSKTLDAVMQSFHSSVASGPTPARIIKSVPGHDIFKLQTKLAQDEGTRMALSLLFLARKSWHRRTRSMYRALLALCILNGELILGSLIFGYMIRDWQSQVSSHGPTCPQAQFQENGGPAVQERERSSPRETLRPSTAMLQPLLIEINANLERAVEHEDHRESVQAALQALAILANLLDERRLAISELSSLIRTLYKVPKLDYQVWVVTERGPRHKNAYEYFRDVLRRLIDNLPQDAAPASHHERIILPALNLSSYNALLNYALRHCLSPILANKVLNHMMLERKPTLQPDITTYNILIRSGTTLRESSIAEHALSILRCNPENRGLSSAMSDDPTQLPGANASWAQNICINDIPAMNAATLYAYIKYLTAIGRPYEAARLLATAVPELRKRRWGLSLNTRTDLQEALLERAVALGPHVFTAILEALCKAGKLGLAERVWLVALAAEKASNNPKYGCQPWTLPSHTCTIMMQCYGTQIRKRGLVVGWARLLPHADRVELPRSVAALRLAHMLYEYAKEKHHGDGQHDPRFLDAALKVFTSHVEAGRHLTRSRHRCIQFSDIAQFSNSVLRQIVHDILDAGCVVPSTWQPFLDGDVPPILSGRCPGRPHGSRRYRPLTYPVMKQRDLIRKRHRQRCSA